MIDRDERERLLESALRLRPEDRAEHIRRACPNDEATRNEILDLVDLTEESATVFGALRRASDLMLARSLDIGDVQHPADPLIGQTVSHYFVEERIGSGGMGTVYRAVDRRLHRPVALKFLSESLMRDDAARSRFAVEAQAASALDHDNICTVYDVGETADGRTFIAMAYYEGETLEAKIAAGPLPIDNAVRIARQIATGLAAAHRRSILHRDIKPSNVIVTPENRVKVLDFGLAKLTAQSPTQGNRTMGTLSYMSPEQVRGEDVDCRSDLWSLGAVLYEMLTGERPFQGDRPAVVAVAIERSEPPPARVLRPEVPDWLEVVIETLLEKHRDRRFPGAGDLLDALNPLASGDSAIVPGTEKDPDTSPAATLVQSTEGILGHLWYRLKFLVTMSVRRPIVRRVAVLPFQNRTGMTDLDALGLMAADWAANGLVETGEVEVLPVASVLGIARLASGPEDVLGRLVGLTRAGTAVVGSIYDRSDGIEYQAQIVNLRRGNLIGAIDPVASPRNEPAEGLPRVRDQVMALLATGLDPFGPIVGDRAARPPRYEAYRAWVDSMNSMWRYDYAAAIRHCDEAAALDPEFSLAHLQAAAVYINADDFAGADDRLRQVEASGLHLGHVDRILFEMWRAVVDWGIPAGLPHARRALDVAPTPPIALVLARIALDANRPREAVDALLRFSPRRQEIITLYWYTLVEAYLMLGEPRRALLSVRRARRQYPDDLTVLLAETLALATLGRTRAVRERMEYGLSLQAQHFDAGAALEMVAERLMASAQSTAAQELLERAIAWYRAPAAVHEPTEARFHLARCLHRAGHLDEAGTLLERLVEQRPDDLRAAGYLAANALLMGNAALAESCEERLEQMPVKHVPGRKSYLRARLAALRGDQTQAVALLHEALRNGQGALWTSDGPFIPVAIDPNLTCLVGDAAFDRLVQPRG